MACLADNRDCVTALLLAGADCNIPASKVSPEGSHGPPGYVGDYLQVFKFVLEQKIRLTLEYLRIVKRKTFRIILDLHVSCWLPQYNHQLLYVY